MKNPKTCKCGKKFEYPSQLAQHLEHHDPQSVKPRFKCQKCDADFSENSSLKRHMITIHKKSQSKRCLKKKTVGGIRNVPNTTKIEKSEKSSESMGSLESTESSTINDFMIENAVPFSDATNDLNKVFNDDLGPNKKGMVPSVHEGKKAYKRPKKQSLEDSQNVPNSTSSSSEENELPLLSDATNDLNKVLNDNFGLNKNGMVPSVREGKKTYKKPKKQTLKVSKNVPNSTSSSLMKNELPFINTQKVWNGVGFVTSDHEVEKAYKIPKKQSVVDSQSVRNSSLIENKEPFIDATDDQEIVLNDVLGRKKKNIVNSVHEGKKEFKCKFCEKSFESKKKWFMHNWDKCKADQAQKQKLTIIGQKSLGKCQNSKTSNHQDQTFPPLSLRNMIVLDEWTNSDSEQKKEIPVEIEPQIIDQNKSTEQLRESMNDLFRSFEDM